MISSCHSLIVNETFAKNKQVKRVFWTLFVAMDGLVLARVVDQSNGAAGGGDDYGDGGMRGSPLIYLR